MPGQIKVKAVTVTLIVLLVASLGTSGYLLMEQNKSEKIINDALQDAGAQKEKLLQMRNQQAGTEKDRLEYQFRLGRATNSLETTRYELEKLKASTALKSSEGARIIAESKRKQSELSAELLVQKTQLAKNLDDYEAIRVGLLKDLDDAKINNSESSAELEKAVNALEPFLSIGLTPKEITELSRKRPVDIAAPLFNTPKPIRPRKINTPIEPETP